MSWSEYFNDKSYDELSTSVEPNSDPTKKAADQFWRAFDVALTLIESGVVGKIDKFKFNVSLSGHANPGHEPAGGWANDMVSVSVSQAGPLETD